MEIKSIIQLNGYDDINFKIETEAQEYVLKTTTDLDMFEGIRE